jgi:ubiquinone/menaquinone biosynthesis C-methylase UbiE
MTSAGRSRQGRFIDVVQTTIRRAIVPLDAVADGVPDGSHVTEIGCGQGILIAMFASRVRQVIGLDYDPRKCEMARAALTQFSNVEIVEADALRYCEVAPPRSTDVAILSDTLSSFSIASQDKLLTSIAPMIAERGRILLKIIDATPRWKATLCAALSTVVYKVLRLSLSEGQQFTYRPREEYIALLQSLGFEVREELIHRTRHSPIPHVLLIAERPS